MFGCQNRSLRVQNGKRMSFIQERAIHVLLVSGLLIYPHFREAWRLWFLSLQNPQVLGVDRWVEERAHTESHTVQPQEVIADVDKDTEDSCK